MSANAETLPAGGERPGTGERPAVGERTGAGERQLATNRPDKIENCQEYRGNRVERRGEIIDHIDNHPIRDFWSEYPGWAAWRINRPYRWATWAALTGWVGYGWSESYPYSYGENVYYEDNSVYYGDEAVASTEEYAQQAEEIAAARAADAPYR